MSLYLGENKVKLHSPTAIAYTKVGNPTITSDGVASGFTDKTDYLTLPAFNPGTSKWKFTTKVKIYDYATQISLIDRNSSTRCLQIVVRTTGKFRVNISTNGSSKANEVDGTHVLSVNTIYYICFEYDGSKYYLKYSLDNINWTTDITINNSTKIYPVSSMCMGHSWYNSGTEKWNGEIYLRYTRFEIDGVTNDKYKLHALEGDYAIVDDRLVWANPNIYLQSSGTQYIDTGIIPNGRTTIDVKYIITNAQFLFGARTKFSQNALNFFREGTGRFDYDGQSYIKTNTGNYQLFSSGRLFSEIRNNKYYFECINSGVSRYAEIDIVNFNSPCNMTLFVCNSNNVAGGFSQSKIYYFKICDNNILIRHFVPVPTGMVIGDFTVPSNGMFDIVNQQFYPNQGTGTFTYGKDE